MIKIDKIKVNGYKNVHSADLQLGNFNVIIGANNSGKSNFIQSISFLNYLINSSLDDLEKNFDTGFKLTHFRDIIPTANSTRIKKISDLDRDGVIEFELQFSNSYTNRIFEYQLQLEWESKMFKSKFKIKTEKLDVKDASKPGPFANIFNRTYETVKYGSEFSKMDVIETVPNHFSVVRVFKIISQVKKDYKDAIDSLNEIVKTPIFYFSNIELLKSDKDRTSLFNGRIVSFELEDEIIALEESKQWRIFKEAINDILSIEDVVVVKQDGGKDSNLPPTNHLILIHHGIFKSLSHFSDGTLLILALITKIVSSKNHLLFIEEPENSTHPRALVDLIAFIKSFSENTQFIITSHSIAILNKTRIEDIIASTIDEEGFCDLYNVSSRKDLRSRLKKSRVNFSDELFFGLDDKNEFE